MNPSEQGVAVSLAADGNTAIIGGPADNSVGAAWIWTRTGGLWTQQGTKLVSSGAMGNAIQGTSVCLSGDGNTAIVGGPFDNNTDGAVWVWTRSGGVWTQQGGKLVGSGAVGNAQQGTAVSLSADGNTALVGGAYDDNVVGAGWVWTRVGGVWTQQGTKLVGSGVLGGFSRQGDSVSISANGNTALIGGPRDNNDVGAAWVWKRNGVIWTQQSSKLVGFDLIGTAFEGNAVSLSADGFTAILGAPNDSNNAGAALVFVPAPDLNITKSITGGPLFPAGGNITYTIAVVNNGPGAANNVTVTDVLPAGTTFVSATSSLGSCSGTTTVTCVLGALTNGSSATISLTLTSASTPGPIANTATVTATETDLNPANNTSTLAITTVNPAVIPAASMWVLVALAGILALLGAMRIRG